MKRNSYVDNKGNQIDQSFESKKPILYFFFMLGTLVPLVLLGFIIYTAVENTKCNNIYKEVEKATYKYLKEEDKLPLVEGEEETISISKLYDGKYLSTFYTNDMVCSGTVKTTKYKKDYLYTLNLTSCSYCTTNGRYSGWSGETSSLPNKPIIDVIPYYNYYERQIVVTDWSKYYEKEELSKKTSKYGIKLPEDDSKMPEVPEEGNIVEAQKEEIFNYRYKDKRWKWYDIVGDYSEFSSEQPDGYANKDGNTKIYTKWTTYSLTHPDEKPYRTIAKTKGYQYYYIDDNGKKVYANNKNYVAMTDIDKTKYNKHENGGVDMFRYRDAKWRWYNGTKRHYSQYSSTKPSTYIYRDDETEEETAYSSWESQSRINETNSSYRTEEKKVMTRFRYLYEILSDPVLETPITKNEFTSKVGMSVPEFMQEEDYKVEVSYKFKYRKR